MDFGCGAHLEKGGWAFTAPRAETPLRRLLQNRRHRGCVLGVRTVSSLRLDSGVLRKRGAIGVRPVGFPKDRRGQSQCSPGHSDRAMVSGRTFVKPTPSLITPQNLPKLCLHERAALVGHMSSNFYSRMACEIPILARESPTLSSALASSPSPVGIQHLL